MTLVMIAASPSTYGHTFSQNENSLFLTRVAQAHSQLNLIENLVLNGTSTTTATNNNSNNNNAKSVQAHVMQTIALLNEKRSRKQFYMESGNCRKKSTGCKGSC
jgi:adenylosuccinate lyase